MGAKNPIVLGADDEKIMDLMTKDKVDPMHVMVSASYEPEGEQIDELNRLEREQGKQSGGSSDPAYRSVKKTIRGMEGKPAGQRKKVPGKKPPVAGEYGSGKRSPAQEVELRRAARKRSQDNMSSRFD
jgi:hypothetical protein